MDTKDRPLSIPSWIRAELPVLLIIVTLMLAARSSLADHYYVPSGSMEHTLIAGDRVLVNKMAYGLRVPFTKLKVSAGSAVKRGDVVIFDSPRDGARLIKRIVATGGDVVEIHNGALSINGVSKSPGIVGMEVLGERLISLNLEDGGGPDVSPTLIPDGMLLAVGDHRGSSLDGRFFGLVPESEIYGKALGVYRRKGEGFVWRAL